MKKNLQRFGASVLAAAMVAQSVALPAAAETTKIDSSVAQSVAASAASAASAVQSLPKFTSTADLIKQTAQTLAAQGEVHELEQDDAKLEAFGNLIFQHPGKLIPDAVIVVIRFRDIDLIAAAGMGTTVDKGKLERQRTVKVVEE